MSEMSHTPQKQQQPQQQPQDTKKAKNNNNEYYDVIIVGAGVAGVSAAYHLSNAGGVTNMLIIDAGPAPGEGIAPRHSGSATMAPNVAPTVKMMVQLFAGTCDEFSKHHNGLEGCRRYLTATKRGLHLQKQIAKDVLLWQQQQQQQQQQPNNVENDDNDDDDENDATIPQQPPQQQQPKQHIRELGSYYVAFQKDRDALRCEFDILQSLMEDDNNCTSIFPGLEWIENLQQEHKQYIPGLSETDFYCGIYFPQDAIIDSSLYAKSLMEWILMKNHPGEGGVTFRKNTKVQQVIELETMEEGKPLNSTGGGVIVQLESGEEIRSSHVIMATGGLFQIPQLNGILKPCYSYLVHVPITTSPTSPTPTIKLDHSANFFTWGYTHDWCFTNGKVRCSGEDHFSAYKSPHYKERCRNLSQWTMERYKKKKKKNSHPMIPIDDDDDDKDENDGIDYDSFSPQYGVYSETPDMVPLIGHLLDGTTTTTTTRDSTRNSNTNHSDQHHSGGSRICYLVGCNAWGQTILSYCSSLIPALLGYQDMTEEQRDILRLVSIRRFTHLSQPRLPTTNHP